MTQNNPEQPSRSVLGRSSFNVPPDRLKERARPATAAATEAPKPPSAEASGTNYGQVKAALHQRLLDEIDRRNLLATGEDVLAAAAREFVATVLAVEDIPLNQAERKRLADDLI